MCGPMSKRT